MKKTIMILAAMALVLGLPQCKKQTSGVLEGNVEITLDVSANKGSRIHVDTDSGDVAFEQNDVVYVGSGGKFVGTLTLRGTVFKGQITDATLREPLCFFFLGNKTPAETLTAGTSTSCSVNISDQTSKLPVISFATSDQDFTGPGNYTAFFLNKAALVKFDVTTPSTLATTSILGMNNKVTVSFADNSFGYSQDGEGTITLPAGSGERWAILLPQSPVAAAVAQSGDGLCTGTCGSIPTIAENGYLADGIEVTLSGFFVDLGLPSGLLWATYNVGADTPEGYGDYFAWGETTTKDTYYWSTYQHCNGSENTLTKYCQNSSYGNNGFTDDLTTLEPSDDAAAANWGNGWRMPTKAEFEELKNNTNVTWETQNGVNGRLFTATNGNSLFLPAAGYRYGSNLSSVGSLCHYWSSSLYTEAPRAWYVWFNWNNFKMDDYDRYYGYTVRPVHAAE